MIRTAFSVAALALTPSMAYAHDGHPHVGNEVIHHALEGVVIAAAVVVVWMAWKGLRARSEAKQAQRTLNQ